MVTSPVPSPMNINKANEPVQLPVKQEVVKLKGWKRIKQIFIAEDLPSVKTKIFEGVIVPSIKDFIVTVVSDGISLIFYGERTVNARRKVQSSFLTGSGSRISYSTYYASSLSGQDNIEKKIAPSTVGYVEPTFETYLEASECLNDLCEQLDSYEAVTVSDLYNHRHVCKQGVYRDEAVYQNWGWKNFGNAKVTLTPVGYTMNLPAPKPLNK